MDEVRYFYGFDRFGRMYEEGDYITYLTNSGEIKIAYVCAKENGMFLFSKVYTEPWSDNEEMLDAPGTIRNLLISRKTYTLSELDANPWSIVSLVTDPGGHGMFDPKNIMDKSKLW